MAKFIRSLKHTTKFANKNKLANLRAFLSEYQRVGTELIKNIWENGYGDFDVKNDKLDFPKYINYASFNIESSLSGRALSSLATQVAGIISSSTEKRRRLLWGRDKRKSEGLSIVKIEKKLAKNDYICVMPRMPFCANLNSLCSDLKTGKEFDFFVQLKSLGKVFGKIRIPLKLTKRDFFWENEGGGRLSGILVSNKCITLCYSITKGKKTGKTVVGADQGLKTVLTLSDGKTTPEKDDHGHSLDSICSKISKKRKGSKAFEKATQHRKNFTNWSINQLNLSEIDEIRMEDVVNINFGRRASRKMQAWTNTEIRDKLSRVAEENEVRFILQESAFRSQRCSCCGNVRKSNRKGKVYSCKRCGNTMDADLNAAKNHEIDLPDVSYSLRKSGLNKKDGFLWTPNGFFNLDGSELIVPISLIKE